MSLIAAYGLGIVLGLFILAGLGAGWLACCALRAIGEWWDFRRPGRGRGGRR